MITVKFFGIVRIKTGISQTQVQAKTVKDAFWEIQKNHPNLTVKDLKKKVIFVNGKNIIDLKMFRTKLKQGDEITIMSPVSGG